MSHRLETNNQQQLVVRHFKSQATRWYALYKGTDLESRHYQQRRASVLEMTEQVFLPINGRVLEVGCGAGLTTVELARRRYTVEAVDAVEEMIDLTKRHASEANVLERVSLSIGDVYNLQFADNTFDLVLAVGLLDWLHSPLRALGELSRVAKNGGFLILTCPNYWALNRILDPVSSPLLYPLRGFAKRLLGTIGVYNGSRGSAKRWPRMYMYSTKDFAALVASQRLELIKLMTVGFGPFSFLGKRILSDSSGIRLYENLQRLTSQNLSPIRKMGRASILVAKKTCERRTACDPAGTRGGRSP
ncbi:MAG: class I SAM-dependent methyltransferase [Candidatus Bathyarchaeia archaeon]